MITSLILSLLMIPLGIHAETNTVDSIIIGNNQYMYYEVHGEGEPVLLIHGHTLDRRMWNQQWPELVKAGYQVIMPDMRGYGLSSDPQEGEQFTHTDDMATLLDSLGIQQAHIIGLSLGGYIAGELMIMYPERCLSCMMIGGEPVTGDGPSTPRSAEEQRKKKADAAKLLSSGIDSYRRSRANSLVKMGGSRREEIRKSVTEQVMQWRCWQPLHVTARVYYAREAWAYLKAHPNDVRCMLVYGDKDYKSYRTKRYKSDTKTLIIKDSGHMANMEQPEVFNKAMIEWLKEEKTN